MDTAKRQHPRHKNVIAGQNFNRPLAPFPRVDPAERRNGQHSVVTNARNHQGDFIHVSGNDGGRRIRQGVAG